MTNRNNLISLVSFILIAILTAFSNAYNIRKSALDRNAYSKLKTNFIGNRPCTLKLNDASTIEVFSYESSSNLFKFLVLSTGWILPYFVFNTFIAPKLGLITENKDDSGDNQNIF